MWVIAALGICACCLMSDSMHHADNFIPADRVMTPSHITPEWYFLPFYSVLRAIDSKLVGVILLIGSILQFGFLSCCTCTISCWGNHNGCQ